MKWWKPKDNHNDSYPKYVLLRLGGKYVNPRELGEAK